MTHLHANPLPIYRDNHEAGKKATNNSDNDESKSGKNKTETEKTQKIHQTVWSSQQKRRKLINKGFTFLLLLLLLLLLLDFILVVILKRRTPTIFRVPFRLVSNVKKTDKTILNYTSCSSGKTVTAIVFALYFI